MGVLLYKFRNNHIQQEVQVAQIEDKMRGGHLRPSEAPIYMHETIHIHANL